MNTLTRSQGTNAPFQQRARCFPERLKPHRSGDLIGTSELVPFPAGRPETVHILERSAGSEPQRLKAASFGRLIGTSKLVPFPVVIEREHSHPFLPSLRGSLIS